MHHSHEDDQHQAQRRVDIHPGRRRRAGIGTRSIASKNGPHGAEYGPAQERQTWLRQEEGADAVCRA